MPPKSIPVSLACHQCGAAFFVKPSHAQQAKFCSRKCQGLSKSRQARDTHPSKKCENCGKAFRGSPGRLAVKRFCSVSCTSINRENERRKARPERLCDNCGKQFFPKRKTARFCSHPCYQAWWVGKIRPGTQKKGFFIDGRYGYRYIRVNGRYMAEHRIVAERVLGRQLTSKEVVHHIDGDRLNNSPENLQVMSQAEHIALHKQQGDIRRW